MTHGRSPPIRTARGSAATLSTAHCPIYIDLLELAVKISGSVALVTGANRGTGREFVQQLLERGASKVYATARNPHLVHLPGAQVFHLDITDSSQVAAAAVAAPDVTSLVNNAGLNAGSHLMTGYMDKTRLELDTHFYGNLAMVRAFAPVLRANGGGAIVNVLSALFWFSHDGVNAYAAAKAAEWSLTNGIRLELAFQGTCVTGVHVGAVDTAMLANYEGDMVDPAVVVRTTLQGVEVGQLEVVVDDWSAVIKASLAGAPTSSNARPPTQGIDSDRISRQTRPYTSRATPTGSAGESLGFPRMHVPALRWNGIDSGRQSNGQLPPSPERLSRGAGRADHAAEPPSNRKTIGVITTSVITSLTYVYAACPSMSRCATAIEEGSSAQCVSAAIRGGLYLLGCPLSQASTYGSDERRSNRIDHHTIVHRLADSFK